ncbi:hypothetical protein DFH29DRAFT_1004410 [Suillus ampliporus]|nr:hypothetical protein DFH29DRAFT_1004410 [Suillus ampliporus]
MTIPAPGTYVIYNIQYSNQDADLKWGNATVGTPVVGYTGDLCRRQQGLVQLVDLTTDTYAALSGEENVSASGTSVEFTFKLYERKDGEYKIQTHISELVWQLPNGDNDTQVSSSDGLEKLYILKGADYPLPFGSSIQ